VKYLEEEMIRRDYSGDKLNISLFDLSPLALAVLPPPSKIFQINKDQQILIGKQFISVGSSF
jgi:hypothetical protein